MNDYINKSVVCQTKHQNPQCEGMVAEQDDSLMRVVSGRSEAKFIECVKVSPFETLTFDPSRDPPIKNTDNFRHQYTL